MYMYGLIRAYADYGVFMIGSASMDYRKAKRSLRSLGNARTLGFGGDRESCRLRKGTIATLRRT